MILSNKLPLVIVFTLTSGCIHVPPLKDGFDSIESVAKFHLAQISANNANAFTARLVTRQEFHDSVYQHLPEATDDSGKITESDYWGWLIPDRMKSLKKIFAAFGGLKLIRFQLEAPKKVITTGRIRIHRDIAIHAEFESHDGKTVQKLSSAELFKAVVEVRGQYKLWNMNYE